MIFCKYLRAAPLCTFNLMAVGMLAASGLINLCSLRGVLLVCGHLLDA